MPYFLREIFEFSYLFSQVRASILIKVYRAPLFEYNFLIMTR